MQKRRTKVSALPIAASDDLTNNSTRKWNTVAHRKHDDYLTGRTLLALASAFILFLLYTATSGKASDVKSKLQERLSIAAYQKYFKSEYRLGPLPLSRFKSLDYALAHSELVGLYFAASWCRMSTPVSNSLEEAFTPGAAAASMEERILSRQSIGAPISDERKQLAIVYVSSDESETDMNNYSRDNWINVPFESTDLAGLKKYFQVCSRPELEELDMMRKYEIPSLIIIDSLTHGILTTRGQLDLKEHGADALDHWLSLRNTIRGLEQKYKD